MYEVITRHTDSLSSDSSLKVCEKEGVNQRKRKRDAEIMDQPSTDAYDFEAEVEVSPAKKTPLKTPKSYRTNDSKPPPKKSPTNSLSDGTETDSNSSKNQKAKAANKQETKLFSGKSIYLSVFTEDGQNACVALKSKIETLGAKSVSRISSNTTAVIFKNGKPNIVQQARDSSVPIVSPLWIDQKSMEPKELSMKKSTDAMFSSSQQINANKESSSEVDVEKTPKSRKRAISPKISTTDSEELFSSSPDLIQRDTPEKDMKETPKLVQPNEGLLDSHISEAPSNLDIEASQDRHPPNKTNDIMDYISSLYDDKTVGMDIPLDESKKSSHKQDTKKGTKGNAPTKSTPKPILSKSLAKTRHTGYRVALSGLDQNERALAFDIVSNLGGKVVASVDDSTTHVVTTPRRTTKFLAASVRGLWVVSPDWLFSSLEKGHWIPEAEYETAFLPGPKTLRTKKGNKERPIFHGKKVYIYGEISLPRDEFEDLLKAGGAEITESISAAHLCIASKTTGLPRNPKEIHVLTETYILDSISQGELLDSAEYIHPANETLRKKDTGDSTHNPPAVSLGNAGKESPVTTNPSSDEQVAPDVE